MCQSFPDYRDDSEARNAQPGIGHKWDAKKGTKHCHADSTGNSYRFPNPSLVLQKTPPLVVNHQKKKPALVL